MNASILNTLSAMMENEINKKVYELGEKYGFNPETERSRFEVCVSSKKERRGKESGVKASFALPFSNEKKLDCCRGLRYNQGLYTQCQVKSEDLCKVCSIQASKNSNGKPDYGTIEDRMAVGPYDYIDPSGKKPIRYTKIMDKLNLTAEMVIAEAGKLNLVIKAEHFIVEEAKKKPEKKMEEPEKKKGRPKKSKKVIEVESSTSDLFAELVAAANIDEIDDEEGAAELAADKEAKAQKLVEEKEAKAAQLAADKEAKALQLAADKEAKVLQLAEEKAAKALQLAADKEAKAAQLAEEKAAKALQLAAEKEAKALQLAADKEAKIQKLAEEKVAKETKLAEEKAAKEAKLAQEKAAKEVKVAKKPKAVEEKQVAAAAAESEETDKVKKFKHNDIDYLKSTKTGVVYNMEQEVVGVWDETSKEIVFQKATEESDEDSDGEESEDEYEE